jgi:hypothetical protein
MRRIVAPASVAGRMRRRPERFRLSTSGGSGTVSRVETPRSRQAARLRARRRRAQQRARRLTVIAVVGVLAVVTLVLTAFGSSRTQHLASLTTPGTAALVPGTPRPEPVATVGNLHIQLPVSQEAVTAIGFHASPTGAVALKPLGQQINEGLLARLWHKISGSSKRARAWYQLDGGSGPATAVLEVGAPPGTDAYAPVDGTIAAITDTILNGERHGSRIDIRPSAAPSVILSVDHVEPDPSLAVGSAVLAGSSKIGTVVDIAEVERQTLAEHTNDRGDNVAVEVHPAPTSLP